MFNRYGDVAGKSTLVGFIMPYNKKYMKIMSTPMFLPHNEIYITSDTSV